MYCRQVQAKNGTSGIKKFGMSDMRLKNCQSQNPHITLTVLAISLPLDFIPVFSGAYSARVHICSKI